MFAFYLLIVSFFFSYAEKVLIVTHAFNRPEFIRIHKRTFDRFLEDEFEYVVFNDANNQSMLKQIENTCAELDIKHVRIPQHLHRRNSPGHRHMDGIKYSLDQMGFDFNGIFMLIDSDMFLIKPFSVSEYMEGYHVAGDREGRFNGKNGVEYISPLVVFINMNTTPNKRTISFEGGVVENNNCDVGGHMHHYFKNNPTLLKKYFTHVHIGAWKMGILCKDCSNMSCSSCMELLLERKFDDNLIEFIHSCPDDIEFSLDHTFLHYRSGSNWNHKPKSYHDAKTKALDTLLNKIL